MKSLALILVLSGVTLAEPYKVECRNSKEIDIPNGRRLILGGCFVGGVQVSDDPKDKEFAEDFAFMLNEARERRTRNVELKPFSAGPFHPILVEESPLGGCRER